MDVVIWRREIVIQSTFFLERRLCRCTVAVFKLIIVADVIFQSAIHVAIASSYATNAKDAVIVRPPERVGARRRLRDDGINLLGCKRIGSNKSRTGHGLSLSVQIEAEPIDRRL